MPAAANLLQTLKVKISLLADDRVSGLDINVDVDNGVARLTGTVETEEEKNIAEDVAGSVEGVVEVENEIVVSPSKRAEEDIEETLAGIPPESVGMMDLAPAPPAYGGLSPGVITVVPPPGYAILTDEEIASNVRDAIRQDGRITSKGIDVTVEEGRVRLQGVVDSFDEFALVEEVAGGVPGVRGVENDLEIEEARHGGCCERCR